MTFVLTATKVLNILSKTLKDAVSGFFEFYSLREGGGLLRRGKVNIKRKGIGKDSQVSPMNFKSNN